MLQKQKLPTGALVPENCGAKGCKIAVPSGLSEEHLCILHFTLFIENECAEMRRETALGKNKHERQVEFMQKIARRGETLVNTATSGFPMSDELRARVLSPFRCVWNTRKNRTRALLGQPPPRRFAG